MDKSALQKYESQLAAIWRLWSQFRRFLKLAFNTDPRHLKKLLEIANLYASSRRFWATNNPKYLSSALTSYFALRSDWLHQPGGHLNTGLEISGWSDRSSFLKIKRALGTYKIRRVFRPDVWYLKGGFGGLFSGFVIQAPISEFSKIMRFLVMEIPEFETKLQQDSITKLDPNSVGRLESINPRQGQRGLNWYSTFHISPRELTWLVEAAADKDLAGHALSFFAEFGDFNFDSETMRCVAKYCLVLGYIPTGIKVAGWSLMPIKKPDWVNLAPQTKFPSLTEKSKVSPKYFQAENVSVTNGGVIVAKDGFLDWDPAQNPSLDFVAGNHNSVIGTSSNTTMCFVRELQNGENLETAILLGSRVDSNWFHFLIETLPRLLWLDGILPDWIPVAVSSRIPDTALEALRLVTKRDIRLLDSDKWTSVQKAFVAGPTVYHPDSQFLWNRGESIEINLESLMVLREKVLRQTQPSFTNKRHYWVREGSQRVVTNERKVRRALVRRGFVAINPAALSFEEQVKSAFEAGVLVTSGGASMSNFIFANEQTSVAVLVSAYGSTYPVPKILASISGAKLHLVSGRSSFRLGFSSLLERSHSSFTISLRALRNKLSRIIAS